MGDDPSIVAGRQCLKCDLPARYYSVNPKQAVYCRDCYLSMIHHKFSYVIGKNRVFRDGNKRSVIVVWRGSPSDNFLLHCVEMGVSQNPHKRMEAKPVVVVILESVDLERFKIEYGAAKERELQMAEKWDWKFVPLYGIFGEDVEFLEELRFDEEKASTLRSLIGKSSAKSDRLELKSLLTELLVYKVALKLGIDKVMTSDSADLTAQKSFDAICFGRGAKIAQLASALDTRFPGVTIIRPLRDITDADIGLSLRLASDAEPTVALNPQVAVKARTIQGLNADFLSRLQVSGFPSTLSSVIMTSTKVEAPPVPQPNHPCLLCLDPCPIDKTEDSVRQLCPSCSRLLAAIPSVPESFYQAIQIGSPAR
uniref:Cytoplasmic tRNA 2-thiolation protein 2 n=1 Tax=Panagrellus redivivus TaxID=6233 RepID=A0A7E4V0E5_PANRE